MVAKKCTRYIVILGILLSIIPLLVSANEAKQQEAQFIKTAWPTQWMPLKSIVLSRVSQSKPKMKLTPKQMDSFELFLNQLNEQSTIELLKLQEKMPKTTVELIRSVESRGVTLEEAEKMAAYLNSIYIKFHFENPSPFDENTSHIIGREWHEIDYSGENMTWQKQRQKYLPYGIKNFKSVVMLEKFFPIEAALPYFKKIYKPLHPDVLSGKT